MNTYVKLAISASLVLLLAAPAAAGECEGVTLPDSVEVNGNTLSLNGLGVREATAFSVNVYVAGLYLENTSTSGSSIISSDEHKQLILHFVRDVDVSDITEAWQEGFENNASNAMALMPRIAVLNGYMGDIEDGQTLIFTYVPGTGTTVEFNGRERGTIEGADFASGLFSIWLGSDPPNSGLKEGLLGGECG